MTQESPWYESFFGEDYLDVYRYQFTEERARQEVDFATRALSLQAGEQLLDLCCGQGRHAVLFAANGLTVTAMDLSEPYVRLTEEEAAKRGVTISAVRADMREIPFEAHFDAIVNMFSSFGYLETEAEDAKALDAVVKALKPDGRVLLDLLNRDWVIDNYIQNDWHIDEDGTIYLERRELDLRTSRNHVSFLAIRPDGSRHTIDGHHIRLYTLREAIGMIEAAGLEFEAVYGGFEGETYGIDTRRMIIVARRPA